MTGRRKTHAKRRRGQQAARVARKPRPRRWRRAREFDLNALRYWEIMKVFHLRALTDPSIKPEAAYCELDRRLPKDQWTADAIGQAIKLTFAEKLHLDIRQVACFDKTRTEVAFFYKERSKFKQREKRRSERQSSKLRARPKAMLERLRLRGETPLPVLQRVLSQHEAFISVDGELLAPGTIRKAVWDTAKKLERLGLVTIAKFQRDDGFTELVLAPVRSSKE